MGSNTKKKERKDLSISKVPKMYEESYIITVVSHCQQGKWSTWEDVTSWTFIWADMWSTPQARLSFLIRATYNTLPSPRNLHIWYGVEEPCYLYSSSNPDLKYILSGCKAAFAQDRYRWWRDKVLCKLAELLEKCRLEVNHVSPPSSQRWIQFVRLGSEARCSTNTMCCFLSLGGEWQLAAQFPCRDHQVSPTP